MNNAVATPPLSGDAVIQSSRTPVRGVLLACLLLLAVGASPARVGDLAPGFALPDTMNGIVSLADYSGAPAVLVFYRGFF